MPRTRNRPSNPFIFSRALAPGEAIERRDEVRRLLERVRGGHNVTLYAPRRFGKTSLLRQVAAAAEKSRMLTVRVDLSDALSIADVAVRLEQAYRALPGSWGRSVTRELGSLGLTTPLGGLTVARRAAPEPIANVHSLLEVPARLTEGRARRGLVILDEFQALSHIPGLDGVFRSHLQHHEGVSYIFCGSEPSLLRTLFEDRARPLYGQAEQLRLSRLSFESAHDFVARAFDETGKDSGEVTPEVVSLSELHPQRLMLLAHLLWEQVGQTPATMSAVRTAYDSAMRASATELRYLWDGLGANERRVLVALASGLSPYGREAKAMAGLASSSSAQRAVQALEGRGLVERVESEELGIVDPLLARWVRRHGGARLQIYVVPDSQGGYSVTDGPSFAFTCSQHSTIAAAEAEAARLGAGRPGYDVMIYDTTDPNELPDWAAAR
jgi:hypothetical protein